MEDNETPAKSFRIPWELWEHFLQTSGKDPNFHYSSHLNTATLFFFFLNSQ